VIQAPDEEEQFILRQYSKSIRQLTPHFLNKSKSSIRVALIACLVFVCLEFLRGHYQTGNEHLKNGMRLLEQLGRQGSSIDLRAGCDPTDTWILETFVKLNLQANLLGHGTRFPCQVQQAADAEPLPLLFESISEARKHLDWLQHEIVKMAGKREHYLTARSKPCEAILQRQQLILAQLVAWKGVYTVSRSVLLASTGPVGRILYTMLLMYYHMAFIMASTCLDDAEDIFDCHTEDFLEIVTEAIDLNKLIVSSTLGDTPFAHKPDVVPFTSDKGWIPPLYFTAIKCRAHRIRMQAIRLLKTVPSKEGIWDAEMAATIGTEVMRLEEQSLDPALEDGDNFTPYSILSAEEARSSFAPSESRFSHVQVTLPNGRHDTTTIRCIPVARGAANGAVTREYDPVDKLWHDTLCQQSANVPVR
jgi:hypothetical protein